MYFKVMFYGFYHGKSPFCTTIWGVFFGFPSTLSKSKFTLPTMGPMSKGDGAPLDFSGNKYCSLHLFGCFATFERYPVSEHENQGQFGIFLERNNQKEMRMHRKRCFIREQNGFHHQLVARW